MTKEFLGYEFTEVTAICGEFPEDGRRKAIFIHNTEDAFCDGDRVVFEVGLPEDKDEALSLLEEPFDRDWGTLESVVIGVYAVWKNWAEYHCDDCDDFADWYDTCSEALEAARTLAGKEGNNSYILKYIDGESTWSDYIEVEPDGSAWSNSWDARDEMGCIQ